MRIDSIIILDWHFSFDEKNLISLAGFNTINIVNDSVVAYSLGHPVYLPTLWHKHLQFWKQERPLVIFVLKSRLHVARMWLNVSVTMMARIVKKALRIMQ